MINIQSEIGKLNEVILHRPGVELNKMMPANAHEALYSDILNKENANTEYNAFEGALNKLTKTHQLKTLLAETLNIENAKKYLINKICSLDNTSYLSDFLLQSDNHTLANFLIEGLDITTLFDLNIDTHIPKELFNIFKRENTSDRYIIKPLFNLFFTRDIAMTIGKNVFVSNMAHSVRAHECTLIETIFKFHPNFSNSQSERISTDLFDKDAIVEGGDVLVLTDNILLIGTGGRTNIKGISNLMNRLAKYKDHFTIIVQELPLTPESFIHLDMVFTLLDNDCCMAYTPVILGRQFKTVSITIKNGTPTYSEEKNLIEALKKLNIDLKVLSCGGSDYWNQSREQWHSGANFFALAPGQVIGYARNLNTIDELNKNGFDIIEAAQIASGNITIKENKKTVITLQGSELPRGGGGCRCMTLPVCRENI